MENLVTHSDGRPLDVDIDEEKYVVGNEIRGGIVSLDYSTLTNVSQ